MSANPDGAAPFSAALGMNSDASSLMDIVQGRELQKPEGLGDSAPQSPSLPQPAPNSGRLSTPAATTVANGESSSRAASAHPEASFTLPTEAPRNGAPVRQYLNSKVTGPLLEGMKMIAKEQPRDPLRVLGEYLLHKSKELEGTS